MKGFKTIDAESEDEWVVEKSRFIAFMAPVDTEEQAALFLERIRKQHWSATHHVPAWVIGLNGSIQKFSDDGEPSGTAGLPVLESLKMAGLVNTAIVVVRYFGGIKLGTGGLVRAYGQSARQAIEKASVVQVDSHVTVRIGIDYTWLGKIQAWLASSGLPDGGTEYTDQVVISVHCPETAVEETLKNLTDMTNGTANLVVGDPFYLACKNGAFYNYEREVRL